MGSSCFESCHLSWVAHGRPWLSYGPELDAPSAIPFSADLRDTPPSFNLSPASFAQLAMGSPNPSFMMISYCLESRYMQCSQPSGAPVGPGGGTAETPGRDRTAKCSPSSSLNSQDGRH